jgi:hypothetical protein
MVRCASSGLASILAGLLMLWMLSLSPPDCCSCPVESAVLTALVYSMSAWVLPDHIADVLPSEARHIEELQA